MHLLRLSLRRWGKVSPLRARGNFSRRLQLRFSLVRLGRTEREGMLEIWGGEEEGREKVIFTKFTAIAFPLLSDKHRQTDSPRINENHKQSFALEILRKVPTSYKLLKQLLAIVVAMVS